MINQLNIIDAIGPFFRDHPKKQINWSKVPFDQLRYDESRHEQFARIRDDMQEFAKHVARLGFNAATLDDLAHLADHTLYEDSVRVRIAVLREEYSHLIAVLKQQGLAVYITMDVFSYTSELKRHLGSSADKINAFLIELIDQFFVDFPDISGLIVRFGESDGQDVEGDFKSELHLKSPLMVNQFLRELLPVLEHHQRHMIVRTWTVGAHRIGDLMWHERTFDRAFEGLTVPGWYYH